MTNAPRRVLVCMIVHTPPTERERQTAAAIGRAVRDARKEQGLRQDELAIAAGVSTRLVHQVENGKLTSRLDGLLRILGALGMTLDAVPRRPGG